MHPSQFRRSPALPVLLALVLAACASSGPRPEPRPDQQPAAQRLLLAGDYVAAAQEFERIAIQTNDPSALLDAGEAWLAAGRVGELRDVLEQLQRAPLKWSDVARSQLLRAELDLLNNLPADALARAPAAADLPVAYRPQLLELRARALLEAGDPWASVQERRALDALLIDPQEQQLNQDQMFAAMQRMSLAEIDLRMRETTATSELYGWLALARVLKTRLYAGEPLDEALIAWRQRFPEHPAAGHRVQNLLSEYGSGIQAPNRVAALLPLSGHFAPAGEAVRDGLLLAHFDSPANHSSIFFYDTGGTPQGALAALERALGDGADAIIGPLQKESVSAIAAAAPPVTVLGLNVPDDFSGDSSGNFSGLGSNPQPSQMWVFGLAPEDEAIRAAELAISEGHRRALIMVPTDDWGRRVGDAFAIRFENLGGWVVGATQYNAAEQDYSGRIRPLLRLTDSELRHQSLERILARDVEFEPRPRDDVDVIFAAARSEQGRQIRPQLRFHHAGGVPVYATSAIYTGTPNSSRDIDLNGVAFCDGSWMIRETENESLNRAQLSREFPGIAGSAARLYALGIDAYRVLPFLGWLQDHNDDRFPGLTGELWVEKGRVQRSLHCARFVRGEPAALDNPNSSDGA